MHPLFKSITDSFLSIPEKIAAAHDSTDMKVRTEVGLMDCVPIDPDSDIFKCHVCGAVCPIAPQLPERAVCEEHCPDHSYEHMGSDGTRCVHCFAEEPRDWK